VRDPEAVARDVARGYYTVEQARRLWGVVLCDDAVDQAATARERMPR
jgi:N-methylhydantoinase B